MAKRNFVYIFLLCWTVLSLGFLTFYLNKYTNMSVHVHKTSNWHGYVNISSLLEREHVGDGHTIPHNDNVAVATSLHVHNMNSSQILCIEDIHNSTILKDAANRTNSGPNKPRKLKSETMKASKDSKMAHFENKPENESNITFKESKETYADTKNNQKNNAKKAQTVRRIGQKAKNNIRQRILERRRKTKEKQSLLSRTEAKLRAQNIYKYKHDLQYLNYMKCPNTLRNKMSRSKALKGKYIKDVPILLSREHVTRSEYDRLKIFRDTTGWKRSRFEVISKTMDLLNTPSNKYLFDDRLVKGAVVGGRCIRCAVVGNGGILNGSRMGREIDSHDYVFRTNVAITKGHEDDVGNKTSFYCFGMKTLSGAIAGMKNKGFSAPPWNPGIRYVFLPEDDWAYRYIYAALTNHPLPKGSRERYAKREPFKFPKPLVPESIKVIHPDFCRYVDNSWLKSAKLRRVGRATTGAIMIFLALHTCDQVNAYGFMGDPTKFTFHYYDHNHTKSNGITNVFWHDWKKENTIWKLLIKEGIFHMYTRH